MTLLMAAAPVPVPTLPPGALLGRVLLAVVLGGLIGFEREFRDQPAGFRTHILVSVGAALFTMAGAYGVSGFVASGSVSFDPTRIAAQVVTGIGFLGAGAIIRQGVTIRGLTTAAALWVAAAVGVAVGLGYYLGALATMVATVGSLFGLKQLEATVIPKMKRGRHNFFVEMGPELRMADVSSVVESHHARIVTMKIASDAARKRQLVMTISIPPEIDPESVAQEMRALEGVTGLRWD
ncbi:MAG: MgtC/SapB family protein [Actinomycetota bacterium]|nr:MgtC/SapB family protein [Actinomycetota bacterium]